MNHKHRKTLHALFTHPISANISHKSVDAVINEMGSEIEERHGGWLVYRLNGHFAEFLNPHHTLHPDQVRHVRKRLEDKGTDSEKDTRPRLGQ